MRHARKVTELNTESQKSILSSLMSEVWNEGDFRNLDKYTSPDYTIEDDSGDPWNRKTINQETYQIRVAYSRNAFPDIKFDIQEMIEEDEKIAVRWIMSGTHKGDLPQLPATGKAFSISGMTFYYFKSNKFCAHRQAFDQLGFLAQIGMLQLNQNA